MHQATGPIDPGELLTTRELSRRYGISVGTVQNWRSQGRGPTYVKLGRSVRYRVEDIEAFVQANRVALR